jgi:hypothetical protein
LSVASTPEEFIENYNIEAIQREESILTLSVYSNFLSNKKGK